MKSIPVLHVSAHNLAMAWEKSLVQLVEKGCDIKTEYDKEEDPPSKDCTMTLVVENPVAEPRIHLDFPGGPVELQEYVMEVLFGIKDHLVRDASDEKDTRWEYTYHQRFFGYDVPNLLNGSLHFDQIETIAQKIAKTPYTRRAQAITWKVWEDNDCYDPACLQSIWCRCLVDEDDVWWLNMNLRIRSNDAYKAAFMNMFAFIMLQQSIADRIAKISDKVVKLGRYCHHADSYHLYGSYFNEFEERFIGGLARRPFEERTAKYSDWKEIMDEAAPGILEKAAAMGR